MDKTELEAVLHRPLTEADSPDTYRPPAGWRFMDSFPLLEKTLLGETLFSDPRFTIGSSAASLLPATFQADFGYPLTVQIAAEDIASGVIFSGSFTVTEGQLLSRLLPPGDYLLEGPVEFIDDIPRLWLKSASSVNLSIAGLHLPITLQMVAFWYDISTDDARALSPLSFLCLQSEIKSSDGLSLPLIATFINADPTLIRLEADTESLSAMGFSEIASLFEDVPLSSCFSPAFAFLDDLSIPELTFTISTTDWSIPSLGLTIAYAAQWDIFSNPRIVFYNLLGVLNLANPFDSSTLSFEVGLFGNADIDTFTIEAYLGLSNMAFNTGLDEDQTVDIINLVNPILSNSIDMPTMVCTEFNISGQVSAGDYSLRAVLEDTWDILGDGKLLIEKLAFDFAYTSVEPAGTSGFVLGVFMIAGVEVEISAAHNSQPNTGWQFKGSTGMGQQIPIGALIQDLVNLFGDVTLPSTLADLTIANLIVEFNTLTRNFKFTGEAKFPIDDQAVDITVTIEVTNQGTNYTKAFGGWITIGSLQFTLNFIQNNTSDFFVATYSHTGEPQAVSIKDLMASVSSSVAAYIPDVLEVELKDVLFAYSKTTGTSPETKFLFGFDVGTGINLSNLPLVGHEFPPDQTIGVDDLQVLVASKLFNLSLVSQLNALFPEGVTKLPSRDLNSGLSISAIMQFGGSPDTLDLPVASDSPTTQATTSSTTGMTTTAGSTSTSTDNIKWFTLQKAFGPVSFQRVGVQYKDEAVWFLLDAAITGAGLTLSLNGLSVGSPLDAFDPQFNLLGLGVSYQSGSTVTIGGAFLRKQVTTGGETYDEYDGAVVIKAEELTLSAMGSYAELKGQPSLFVYGLLDYPIGGPAFFFVTGLAAGFGYNRKLIAPTIDQVAKFPLVEEAINGIRTPSALTDELTKLQPYIPPSIGDNFLVFGVKFTSFKLIDSFVLLTVMFGKRLEVNVLGLSSLIVPTPVPGNNPVTPLAKVQMELKATYYPDDGLLAINAQLTSDSYIISRNCHLAGGFAFYTWFTGDHAGDFVQTLGGYHPNFNKPSHYPKVPRLSFNWKVDNNLTLKGDAYYAITPSTLMAGGSLDASWKDGDIKATFKAKADFLISWKPYHYDAHISVNVSASYKFKVSVLGATVHKTISADVGADVHIWGPEFSGKASVDISVISFDITFGSRSPEKKVAIDWQTFKESFLPASETVGISVGDGLVSAPQTQETYWVINPKHFYLVLNSAIPAKAAYRLNTKQSLVGTDQTPFGIGPMELKAEKLSSDFYVEITHDNVSVVNDEFALTPILKNVPAALWGETMTPSLKGPGFITNALCGFEVRPANPPTADVTQPIARSNLQYDSTPVDNAFAWASTETFQATTQNDSQREANIRTTIVSDDAAAARTRLMATMGVTVAINLSEATADAFLIAPLIEA